MTHHVCSVISPAEGGHGTNGILTASPEKPMKHPWQVKTHGVVDKFFQPNPLIFPYIVWGSCFSLGYHPGFPSLTTPHSSTSHTSLYTSHLSHLPHHSPLFTTPLITSHSSFTTLHYTTPHSSTSHTSHIISPQHSCGALGPRLPFAWQAQYTERPGGAAARVVTAEAAAAFRVAGAVHRASAVPLWEELRRAWPLLARGCLLRGMRMHTEPPGGAAARMAAAGPRLPFASGSCFFTWIPPLLFPPPPS